MGWAPLNYPLDWKCENMYAGNQQPASAEQGLYPMALLLVLSVILLIVQIFFLIQVTEVGIHVLNPEGIGFWVTANPFAWVLVFILLAVMAAVIRLLFRMVNILATALLGTIFCIPLRKKQMRWNSEVMDRVGFAALIVWFFWFIACFYLTAAAMDHFVANPQLNSWLAEGNWLAHVLVYGGILGLVTSSSKND